MSRPFFIDKFGLWLTKHYVQQQSHHAKHESIKLLWVSGLFQEDEDKKASKEAASSRPHDMPEGEPPAKRKKLKESYPPPDRLPSSEYCDSESDDEEENENGKSITLHEELHEELYGLPTPRKCAARDGSGEIAPTDLDQSPESVDDSDDDGDALGESAGHPSGDTTGTHKDHIPCMAHLVPHCCFLMWNNMI